MSIDLSRSGRSLIMRLCGHLDARAAERVRRTIPAIRDAQHLVIDLEAARSLDPAGLAAVVATIRGAHQQGMGVTIRAEPNGVAHLLRVAGLDCLATLDLARSQKVA